MLKRGTRIVLQMRMPNKSSFFVLLAGLAILAPLASAKDKKPKASPQEPKDAIEVVGHIPPSDGPVTRFLTTQHYSSYYLYAEHGVGRNVTLIDVTKANQPLVLANVPYASGGDSESLTMVAGTAALMTSESGVPAAAPAPQTVRIMDFSVPQNSKIAREFTGVTATSTGDRGLIFVANTDGIWILRRRLAEDPEAEKAYANYVLYGSSMYPPSR
jgi:hypothetical protein